LKEALSCANIREQGLAYMDASRLTSNFA